MPNRLIAETSPYLRQHADNPVDWHPWGPEVLDLARRTDRPILLSIGYSSCHWCHVMERESFEDATVAELMNRSFVNVKVDREERPDVDRIYMQAVQALTGHGGWPLTVFLTPDGRPFYGGTYFPPAPRQGIPSFRQVLEAVSAAFRDRRRDVERGAEELVSMLRRAAEAAPPSGDVTGTGPLDDAVRALTSRYDPTHGGFGRAPKFPQPATLEVLLRHHLRSGDPRPLRMAETTLRRMAAGGIRDHLGGGFHRYSVDERWLVPHFEKMLYDNALLAQAYLDAWRVTGSADLREVAEDTLDWMLADMRSPEGGFYSALDADSGGEEGAYYLWTAAEVEVLLGAENGALFARAYDVGDSGNFEGKTILWLPHDVDAVARGMGLDPDDVRARLRGARSTLLEARRKRAAPFRDEKLLASWNALTLRALAEAGAALSRPDYLEAAARGADFLHDSLAPTGRLLHVLTDGVAKIPAFLEDWAGMGNAFLSLHEATLEPRWLERTKWCCEEVIARFRDERRGLFHDAEEGAEPLFLRPRDPMDNATPSGSSLAAELLARSAPVFGEARYRDVALETVARDAETMRRWPTAFGRLLSVADRLEADPVEVVIVGESGDPLTRALAGAALRPFHRNRTVVGSAPGWAPAGVPLLEGRGTVDGRAAAWVCRGSTCLPPVMDPEALRPIL